MVWGLRETSIGPRCNVGVHQRRLQRPHGINRANAISATGSKPAVVTNTEYKRLLVITALYGAY